MDYKAVLFVCDDCNEMFIEEIPECKLTLNGVVSAEWRNQLHHGSQLSLMGFATVVKSSCSKVKGSSRR